jgi:hypothetical protein
LHYFRHSIATVERREASVPRYGTQGASLGAWRAAAKARSRASFTRYGTPTGASHAPERFSALRPPLDSGSVKQRCKTRAQKCAAGRKGIVQDEVMRTEGFLNSSCAGLTRASIFFARSLTKWMDCRVKPGNDGGVAICSICAAPGSERNPRLQETAARAISLFPDCYLQWLLQLQRVGPPRAHVAPSVVTIRRNPICHHPSS